MPKYVPGKASPVSVAVAILIFIGVVIYAPVFLAIVAGVAIFMAIWSYIEGPKTDNFYETLHSQRDGLSICDFSREFDCKEIDTWVIRAV